MLAELLRSEGVMERREVQVKKHYTLHNGQIVRVISIHNEMARCDMFDELAQARVFSTALPLGDWV